MTLTSDTRDARSAAPQAQRAGTPNAARRPQVDRRPVEFWPTSSIRAALETDDLNVWQRITTAIKRDPYGRTARQVEEVLDTARPYGVSRAMAEVLSRAREHLAATECAEVARHVRLLLERSGLAQQEFSSRIGVPSDELASYLSGAESPSAALMIRMRRLSDRFAKMHDERQDKNHS